MSRSLTRISSPSSIFAILAVLLCIATTVYANDWRDASSLSVEDAAGAWLPLELPKMSTHSMTDRELFEASMGATGGGPGDHCTLNYPTPPVLLLCRPTELPGWKITCNCSPQNDTLTITSFGTFVLHLKSTNAAMIFTVTDGVTFSGDSTGTLETDLQGSLDALNAAIASLLVSPYPDFIGVATIDWTLRSEGGSMSFPQVSGTVYINVGSPTPVPVLKPLASNGILAGFNMSESTTSDSFPGVKITDEKYTSQTLYHCAISSYEGTLLLATEANLRNLAKTSSSIAFDGFLPDIQTAFNTFKFQSSVYGAYNGNAGFLILCTNTFRATSGFIQANIKNIPAVPPYVTNALPPPTVSQITNSGAVVSWSVNVVGGGAPQGYRLEISTSPSGTYTQAFFSNSVTTTTLSGLTFATRYYLKLSATSASNTNPTASPIVSFITAPNLPSAPTGLQVTSTSATSISLSWQPPANNGGGAIQMYTVQAQTTANLGTNTGVIVEVSFASATPTHTFTGLSSSTSYTFFVIANNAAGPSPPSSTVQGSTQSIAPKITSYIAKGTGSTNSYANGVVLTIGFNMDTNTPNVADATAINALFKFFPSIGTAYTGQWTDPRTLEITITNAGSASPQIGTATVTVIGALQAASGSSAYSTSISPALTGCFGNCGSLGAKVLTTKSNFNAETTMDAPTSLGVTIDLTPLFPDGSYTLIVSVISPLLPGSQLSGGSKVSSPGLVVSVNGAPADIQSGLDTLMYTPAPGFTGAVSFSFQLKNQVTNELLASLVTSLSVLGGSTVPIITSPDSVAVVLETYTAVTDISVSSSSSGANSVFVLDLSTSHTGSAMFSQAVAGVSFVPPQGTESFSHELTGTIDALNSALLTLQVKFSFSTNSAQNNYAPDPYTITIELADTSSGTDAATTNSAVSTISAKINCQSTSIVASQVTSAELDNSANSIVVTLDNPVSDDYLATPVFDCATMLSTDSIALLGESPVCHWTSTLSFSIRFGIGATFQPGQDTVTIVANGLQRCYGGANTSPSQSFQVNGPQLSTPPTVFISGPTTTSLCNTLTLQGISAMVGGRAPIYSWQLPRNLNPIYAPAALDTAVLQVDPNAFGDGGSFEFGLTVKNFLGQTSTLVTRVVTATNMPVPIIFPTSVTEIDTTATQTIRVYNSIIPNPCFNEPLKPMVFKWTITPDLPAGNKVSLNTANLIIPRNTLTPSTKYVATLQVSIATNSLLYSTIDYTLNIVPSDLQAKIRGGEWRKVRMDAADWVLDGSASSDDDQLSLAALSVDLGRVTGRSDSTDTSSTSTTSSSTDTSAITGDYAANQYSYMWTCTAQNGGNCYSNIDGTAFTWTSSQATLKFPANSLKVGLYLFSLTYTHLPSQRTATSSALISVRTGVNPTAYGASGTVDCLVDATEAIVNPQGKLHIIASLPTYYSDRTDDLTYTWSVLGGGSAADTAAALNLADATNVQGMGTSTLVVNPHEVDNFFVAGTDYHFKVSVQHADDLSGSTDAGEALVYVHVNSLPTCDSFVVTSMNGDVSNTGISFNTSYTVAATNCYDSDTNDLLTYQFFRMDAAGNRYNVLPASHSPLGQIPFLPTGATALNYVLTLGVVVTDSQGGRQEYTREVKVLPNSDITMDSNGIHTLRDKYTNTWAPNYAISGDTETVLSIISSILSELNEIASVAQLNSFDQSELLDFKRQLMDDITSQASTLPTMQVLQAMFELVDDSKNVDLNLIGSVLDFITSRAQSEPGTSTDQELLNQYMRIIKNALDYVVKTNGVVTVGGGNRRLFAMDMNSINLAVSDTVGVASTSSSQASPMSILDSAYKMINIMNLDISARALVLPGETYPINLPNTQGFTGAVGRGIVGQTLNVSTSDGYSVIVSAQAFSDQTAGANYDVSVFGTNPMPYIGLVAPADSAGIVSGGASVQAYLPQTLADSTPVSTFTSGGIEVEIPFNIALTACVLGDSYAVPATDAPASGNVFGNMCQMGCKVWNPSTSTFSDQATTVVALHPLSMKLVCGLSAPGIVVVTSTRLTTPYVPPVDSSGGSTSPLTPVLQANGLPHGVVRASMRLIPAPTIFDLNKFKSDIAADLASVLNIDASRITVQAVSTSGTATTIIFDFLAPSSGTDTTSQSLYDKLISLLASDLKSTKYLKNVELLSISELCDDSVYRHQCTAGSSPSWLSKWLLPIIIAAACLVAVCLIGITIVCCVRMRRRAAGSNFKRGPELAVTTDAEPAKKFVYTDPSQVEPKSPGESMSEIVLRPTGLEFEPSHKSDSEKSVTKTDDSSKEESVNKNRLSAKFPNRHDGSSEDGNSGPEESRSQSSHHFYYVDAAAQKDSNSKSGSRSSNTVAFTIDGGSERSKSSSSSSMTSRSHNSQSQPTSPVSEQRNKRRGSAPSAAIAEEIAGAFTPAHASQATEEKQHEKSPLPVVRPPRNSPKQ